MALNIVNVNRLADYMDRLPTKNYNQTCYCGTACCISGHIALINNQNHSHVYEAGWDASESCEWLGIKFSGRHLFLNPITKGCELDCNSA